MIGLGLSYFIIPNSKNDPNGSDISESIPEAVVCQSLSYHIVMRDG